MGVNIGDSGSPLNRSDHRILWVLANVGPVAGGRLRATGVASMPTTYTGGTAMPNTGDKATETVTYASDCGSQWTITIHAVGNEFPPCPHCHKSVHYTKV